MGTRYMCVFMYGVHISLCALPLFFVCCNAVNTHTHIPVFISWPADNKNRQPQVSAVRSLHKCK